eukprot:6188372-Pleurochrysis_carterae.AAC.2
MKKAGYTMNARCELRQKRPKFLLRSLSLTENNANEQPFPPPKLGCSKQGGPRRDDAYCMLCYAVRCAVLCCGATRRGVVRHAAGDLSSLQSRSHTKQIPGYSFLSSTFDVHFRGYVEKYQQLVVQTRRVHRLSYRCYRARCAFWRGLACSAMSFSLPLRVMP